MPVCLRLFRQLVCLALALACASAGSSNAARMAMIAMTTSNSMSVKALQRSLMLGYGAEVAPASKLAASLWHGPAAGWQSWFVENATFI